MVTCFIQNVMFYMKIVFMHKCSVHDDTQLALYQIQHSQQFTMQETGGGGAHDVQAYKQQI
jgi:hypothetical protein